MMGLVGCFHNGLASESTPNSLRRASGQALLSGPSLMPAKARRPRRQRVRVLQVPHDARRRRSGLADLGEG